MYKIYSFTKILTFVFITLLIFSCQDNKRDNLFEGDNKIDFISLNGIPVVKGKINSIDTYFIIDSGASLSVLDESQKDKFKFIVEESDIEAAGYGGTANFKNAIGVNIEIGGVKFSTEFKSQDLSKIGEIIFKSQGVKIGGIVGSDIMHKNKFIIDYSLNSISLSK